MEKWVERLRDRGLDGEMEEWMGGEMEGEMEE